MQSMVSASDVLSLDFDNGCPGSCAMPNLHPGKKGRPGFNLIRVNGICSRDEYSSEALARPRHPGRKIVTACFYIGTEEGPGIDVWLESTQLDRRPLMRPFKLTSLIHSTALAERQRCRPARRH